MGIIIDTNCLGKVFSRKSKEHSKYAPVLNWILKGKGFIIFGGSRYKKELRNAAKYLPLIREFKTIGKALEGDRRQIDDIEKEIKRKIPDKDFDDPHIAAIVICMNCMLFCTDDSRSLKYIKRPALYPKGVSTPKYYKGNKNNHRLLTDKNIHERYKPFSKLCKIHIASLDKCLSRV